MATEIRVPTLGESVAEATIGKWLKTRRCVAVDEPLVELETDKVSVEVPSPVAGVLAAIDAKEGDTVEVGALLGTIGEGTGAAPAPAEKDDAAPQPSAEAAPAPASQIGRRHACLAFRPEDDG